MNDPRARQARTRAHRVIGELLENMSARRAAAPATCSCIFHDERSLLRARRSDATRCSSEPYAIGLRSRRSLAHNERSDGAIAEAGRAAGGARQVAGENRASRRLASRTFPRSL